MRGQVSAGTCFLVCVCVCARARSVCYVCVYVWCIGGESTFFLMHVAGCAMAFFSSVLWKALFQCYDILQFSHLDQYGMP